MVDLLVVDRLVVLAFGSSPLVGLGLLVVVVVVEVVALVVVVVGVVVVVVVALLVVSCSFPYRRPFVYLKLYY